MARSQLSKTDYDTSIPFSSALLTDMVRDELDFSHGDCHRQKGTHACRTMYCPVETKTNVDLLDVAEHRIYSLLLHNFKPRAKEKCEKERESEQNKKSFKWMFESFCCRNRKWCLKLAHSFNATSTKSSPTKGRSDQLKWRPLLLFFQSNQCITKSRIEY